VGVPVREGVRDAVIVALCDGVIVEEMVERPEPVEDALAPSLREVVAVTVAEAVTVGEGERVPVAVGVGVGVSRAVVDAVGVGEFDGVSLREGDGELLSEPELLGVLLGEAP
jgi:hypothetical protein